MTSADSRLRIEKVLSLRTDSAAMIESLDAISSFYHKNTVEARRCLRQDLEFQNIQLAKRFLEEFDHIRERVESVEELSGTLQSACDGVAKRVSEADENMKLFMEKASELQDRSNQYAAQSKDITAFLGKFQLSQEEMAVLQGASLDENASANQFFGALSRLEAAYEECKSMLEKHHYSAGFELLDSLGDHQDRAYQRLFAWVKSECASSTEMTADDVDTKLQTAVKCLRRLPTYLSQCEDLVVAARRAQLVQKFVYALTQGGQGSGQVFRAIDLQAHDAVRYLGDMLAFMHQATASETEFLEAVFGSSSNSRDDGDNSSHKQVSVSAGEEEEEEEEEEGKGRASGKENSATLLARCVQGLGRPLRVRVAQAIESHAVIDTLYACVDLLAFYEGTFKRLIVGENSIHSTVQGCLLESRRLLSRTVQKQATSLEGGGSSFTIDLTASHSCLECARQVGAVIRCAKASLSGLCCAPDDPMHLNEIVGHIVTPLLNGIKAGAQAGNLSQQDTAVLMLNSVAVLTGEMTAAGYDARALAEAAGVNHPQKKSIATTASGVNDENGGDNAVPPVEFAHRDTDWTRALHEEQSAWLVVLITTESDKALARSGLNQVYSALSEVPVGVAASQQGALGLSRETVGTAMRAFYASLFSTTAPQFDKLKDGRTREAAKAQTSARIAAVHAGVHAAVSDPSNGYDTAILTHSPEEVNVLLSVSTVNDHQ